LLDDRLRHIVEVRTLRVAWALGHPRIVSGGAIRDKSHAGQRIPLRGCYESTESLVVAAVT
jgi:hypothetical protein